MSNGNDNNNGIFGLAKYGSIGIALAALLFAGYVVQTNAGSIESAIANHDLNARADNRELINAIKGLTQAQNMSIEKNNEVIKTLQELGKILESFQETMQVNTAILSTTIQALKQLEEAVEINSRKI